MQFREPEVLEDALDVITTMSIFLDLWMGRTEEWQFVQLVAKCLDEDVWKVVAKCVVTKSGLSLVDVPFKELGTKGVLEALHVFCEGLMDIDLPDIYIKNCAGLSTTATLALIKDANKIKQELAAMGEPSKLISTLLSKAIAGGL